MYVFFLIARFAITSVCPAGDNDPRRLQRLLLRHVLPAQPRVPAGPAPAGPQGRPAHPQEAPAPHPRQHRAAARYERYTAEPAAAGDAATRVPLIPLSDLSRILPAMKNTTPFCELLRRVACSCLYGEPTKPVRRRMQNIIERYIQVEFEIVRTFRG